MPAADLRRFTVIMVSKTKTVASVERGEARKIAVKRSHVRNALRAVSDEENVAGGNFL